MSDTTEENRILRGLVQTNPEWKCPHGMNVSSMAECPSGFPGCACADDRIAILCEDEERIVSRLTEENRRLAARVGELERQARRCQHDWFGGDKCTFCGLSRGVAGSEPRRRAGGEVSELRFELETLEALKEYALADEIRSALSDRDEKSGNSRILEHGIDHVLKSVAKEKMMKAEEKTVEPTAKERAAAIQKMAETFAELPPRCLESYVEGHLDAHETAARQNERRRAVVVAKSLVGNVKGAPAARKASWAVRNYDSGWNQCAHELARRLAQEPPDGA